MVKFDNDCEHDLKAKVLEIGREITRLGLIYSTWGNVSVRGRDGFLITPSGMEYNSLKPSDLVWMDFQGNILEGNRKPSVEFQLHQELYLSRTDVNAVIHTHSINACAFAVSQCELPAILEDMIQVVRGSVKISSYALPGTKELAKNACDAIEDRNAVLLPNHGLIAVGKDINEALKACVLVERCAQVYIYANIIGSPQKISDSDIKNLKELYGVYGQDNT